MGQTTSSPSSIGQGESGWMDFVGLWLGAAVGCGHERPRLPTSWEELLAWTDAVTSWQFLSTANTPQTLTSRCGQRKDPTPAAVSLEFHATVDTNFTDEAARLPGLSWIDRAIFYHQNVRIQAVSTPVSRDKDALTTADAPILLTVAELGRLYALGRHVMELKATVHNSRATTNNQKHDTEGTLCAICCSEHENSQLACGHGLCESCEQRWVARKLTCPFCRTRFGSARKATRQAWNITEFNAEELQSDIQATLDQIHELWSKIVYRQKGAQSANTNRVFVALPPQLLETTQGSQDFELIHGDTEK